MISHCTQTKMAVERRMWDSASACIADAKAAGFRVVATHMDSASVGIHDVDWSQPTAIILGNERDGEPQLSASLRILHAHSTCALHKLKGDTR